MAEVDLIPRGNGPIHPARSEPGDTSELITPGSGAEVLRSIGLEPLVQWLETTSYGVCITGENHTWVYLNPAGERIIGGPFEELYGSDYLLHFPEHERAALLALEGNQRAGDTDFYTNTVVRPDGSEIQMTWSGSVITVNGVELAPAIFHETTQVRQAQREAVELAAMLHASATGAGHTQTLEHLVAEAVHDTRACAAGLFLTQDDTGCLRLAAAVQMEADADVVVAAAPVAVADLPGADDLTRGRSIFLSDAVSRYQADPRTEAWPAVVFGADAAGAAQFPVWRDGRVDGVLVVLFPTDVTSPSETDLALLSSLADQTSIVLGTDLVRRSASRASASTERERIARDLHDSVSQGLFSLLARAQVVRRGLRAGNLELALEAAEDLEDLARQATGEMRELLGQLRTDATDTTDTPDNHGTYGVELPDELQRLADTVTRRDGLPVEVTLSPAVLPALSPQMVEHLVRIVGEAVHNAVKHASAQQVLIAVTAQGATLTIEVRDDGVGFVPETATGGLGQDTMRERAALCGGNLTVTSALGSGTTITVGVPLEV